MLSCSFDSATVLFASVVIVASSLPSLYFTTMALRSVSPGFSAFLFAALQIFSCVPVELAKEKVQLER
jgi:hypothetical protein